MYLISVYFDKNTENQIQKYINDVAQNSRNTFMLDNNVPPHITISAFETLHEDAVVSALDSVLINAAKGKIQWVTVGNFPTVIFIQPVLNKYLNQLSTVIYDSIKEIPDTAVSKFYRPFQWLPHATIGKQLSEEELYTAFQTLQRSFSMFESEVVRIEIAKKNPYRVIATWELN